jgi:hypothetical protein
LPTDVERYRQQNQSLALFKQTTDKSAKAVYDD